DLTWELPPLNVALARRMVERTRVGRLLRGGGAGPEPDALHALLVAVARLVAEQPEIHALALDPVVVDGDGPIALDVRARRRAARDCPARLAILPYPSDLAETAVLRDGTRVLLRPIRPEDEPAHLAFFRRLDPDDVRFRFFGVVREMPHSQLARYTQIDYDREMAFVAEATGPGGRPETLGVVRTIEDADRDRAEFAIVVRSDLKGRGLGRVLMEKAIRYCRGRGVGEIVGQVLPDNRPMLDLAGRLGFRAERSGGDVVEVRLPLGRGRRGGGGPRDGTGARGRRRARSS
ncbi:MAG: GNAT family N-acetyltransferase, partial [Myxococcota bacterium]|nr:GNAT family N-acetyltransferase [Myxococcota bacterium]